MSASLSKEARERAWDQIAHELNNTAFESYDEYMKTRKRVKAKAKREHTLRQVEATREGAPPWSSLNEDQLRLAISHIGVKGTVKVKASAGLTRKGAHYFRGGEHVITVSRHSSAEQATRTVIHELTHAKQIEGFVYERPEGVSESEAIRSFRQEYKRETRYKGYRKNRFEQEAFDTAARLLALFDIAQ